MTELTRDDYVALLQGHARGKMFASNYFTVKRPKNEKPNQKQILTTGNVGLPATLNDTYSEKIAVPKRKKRKIVDRRLLEKLLS